VIVSAARTPFGKLGGGLRLAAICSGGSQGDAQLIEV
jgi:hypothetical protein